MQVLAPDGTVLYDSPHETPIDEFRALNRELAEMAGGQEQLRQQTYQMIKELGLSKEEAFMHIFLAELPQLDAQYQQEQQRTSGRGFGK